MDPDNFEVGSEERHFAESEFGFLINYPETHLECYLDDGHSGRLALDVSQPLGGELEVDFTFRTYDSDAREPVPQRTVCELKDIEATLKSLLSNHYVRPPETYAVRYELSFFQIARDALPARGLVAAMLGLATLVANQEMVVTGTQLAIGGELTETVTWYVSDPMQVAGVLRSQVRRELSDSVLIDGLALLAERFRVIVLEQE